MSDANATNECAKRTTQDNETMTMMKNDDKYVADVAPEQSIPTGRRYPVSVSPSPPFMDRPARWRGRNYTTTKKLRFDESLLARRNAELMIIDRPDTTIIHVYADGPAASPKCETIAVSRAIINQP